MGWYVAAGSSVEGPFEEQQVVDAVREGRFRDVKVREQGSPTWIDLAVHPPFASALSTRGAVQGVGRRQSSVWMRMAAIGSVATPAVIGAACWIAIQSIRDTTAQQTSRLEAKFESVVAELRSAHATTWIDAAKVVHNCLANNSTVNCTFTNAADHPVTTCLKGTLTAKVARGVTLESTIMCTGRLAPRETRELSAPWSGGFARDICKSSKPYVGETLDWDTCSFSTTPVDLTSASGRPATE